jgi:hypothetical protein
LNFLALEKEKECHQSVLSHLSHFFNTSLINLLSAVGILPHRVLYIKEEGDVVFVERSFLLPGAAITEFRLFPYPIFQGLEDSFLHSLDNP